MTKIKLMLVQNILFVVIISFFMISLGNVDSLPWWTFLLPVLILGNVISRLRLNLNAFAIGFIPGFLIWFGGNLLFDIKYNGLILSKVANLLSIPKILLFPASGIIGGVLTGLASYVGKNIFKEAEPSNLE